MSARKLWRAAALTSGLAALAACGTPADPGAMALSASAGTTAVHGSKFDHSFGVAGITGGAETNPVDMAEISNPALRSTLETSLRNLGYLAADPGQAHYLVSADIVGVERPTSAYDPAVLVVPIDMSVTVKIHYTVTPAGGRAPVFDELVGTTGIATINDAITPGGRVRRAEEIAVHDNIDSFLKRLNDDWK